MEIVLYHCEPVFLIDVTWHKRGTKFIHVGKEFICIKEETRWFILYALEGSVKDVHIEFLLDHLDAFADM